MACDHLLIQGDARHIPLADESVHCVVTSPPYYGLRDYGIAGQVGLESTPDAFIATMVQVFREVWRVLRADGTCWVNLGDAYAHSSCGGGGAVDVRTDGRKTTPGDKVRGRMGGVNTLINGYKPKDLLGIPWRTALALQADGWWLRSASPWVKRSAMPESVTDRPASALEYMFQFTKSERYYFDRDAVRKKHVRLWDETNGGSWAHASRTDETVLTKGAGSIHRGNGYPLPNPAGRNWRNSDLWYRSVGMLLSGETDEPLGFDVNTQSYKGAHYATYPTWLVEPCVLSSTSAKGCCAACGAQWVRVVEKASVEPVDYNGKWMGTDPQSSARRMGANTRARRQNGEPHDNPFPTPVTTGWQPTCTCNAAVVAPIVLDPFIGSGTTIVSALKLGRRAIGLDLSREYLVRDAQRRITRPHAPIAAPRDKPMPLFELSTNPTP